MLCYAITDRAQAPGSESERRSALIDQTAQWAAEGIDFIQLREKDLPAIQLAELARTILVQIERAGSPTRLLVNSRPDVAIATGAHGVHLTASPGELTASQIRTLYAAAGLPAPILSLSCHTLEEVRLARQSQPDAILFAPVFGKVLTGQPSLAGQGLERLREACLIAAPVPVYALGGITLENAGSCLRSGAAGVAGIRVFTFPRREASKPT